MRVQSLGQEDPLEEVIATQSHILVWEIPRTEEPGGLQPIESQRVGHDRSKLARRHAHHAVLSQSQKTDPLGAAHCSAQVCAPPDTG